MVVKTASAKKKARKTRAVPPTAKSGRGSWSRIWKLAILLSVVVFFAGARYRLRETPLERDEGEYAYFGQLMLEGVPPYQLAYNMKLPGTYAAYAMIMALFGESSAGIHSGLIVVNVATILILFLLAKKLWGSSVGLVAGIAYGLLSSSASVFGMAAHATHFVVVAALAGLLFLLYALERERRWIFFASGTCLGLAYLMKQPGIVFSAFALVYLAYQIWERGFGWRYAFSRIGAMAAGMAWPFAATCLILYWAGVFPKFWFWTFTYARAYATANPYRLAIHSLSRTVTDMLGLDGFVWLVSTLGLIALFAWQKARSHWVFLLGLLLFAVAGASAGFYFRGHYFILLLPAVALLCGIAVAGITEFLQSRHMPVAVAAAPGLLFAAAVVFSIFQERPFLFAPDPPTASFRRYYGNPFVEAEQVGEYLRTNTPSNARLAIFGSEPEIYFYSHRRSATGYIYTYSLMEDQGYAATMQREMLDEVTRAKPEYVLLVDDQFSWLRHGYGSSESFFRSMLEYIRTEYTQTDQLDISGEPDHALDDTARIYIYSRNAP